MNLNDTILYIKGVSKQKADLLHKEVGIKTCNDLLNFYPFRYIDKTKFYTVKDLHPNSSEVQIIGKITTINSHPKKKGPQLSAILQDSTGAIKLIWFKGQKWIINSIKINELYVVYGKLNYFNGSYNIPHPELKLYSEYKNTLQHKMQPVYRLTEKLNKSYIVNNSIRGYIQNLLQQIYNDIQESLSKEIIDKFKLLSKKEALLNIHFPKSQELLTKAQYRLKFEELFFIQLQLLQKKLINKTKNKGYVFKNISTYFTTFYNDYLPFQLTNAQKKVIKEIRKDVGANTQMNRLLQGDVGSGKTIVALFTILLAIDNGFQAAIMAPTEILATQHFNAISELLKEMKISLELLTGSTKTKKRTEIHNSLQSGQLDILIGTHTLIEDKVQFKNLGIAIIDEQHRFGVAQRSKLWTKNALPPHILVMTATPIPRTLAMTVYGDLDVSVIDELPPNRKEIKTIHRFDSNRLAVFNFMKNEIEKGRQVYVVYPLIQESEAMDYKDLMDGYESISREFPKPKYQISIMHGKMKPADKDYEMQRFINGETQIMVSTTVIEVGVDIPNASVMVIESSERFGLSQLHQLRGRVGRGKNQSYCVLLSDHKLSEEAKKRLKTMVDTTDGFKIAEADLKLRGPGNLMGTQQSGVLGLKIADVTKDSEILAAARNIAIEVLKDDANLQKPKNLPIKNILKIISLPSKKWSKIS